MLRIPVHLRRLDAWALDAAGGALELGVPCSASQAVRETRFSASLVCGCRRNLSGDLLRGVFLRLCFPAHCGGFCGWKCGLTLKTRRKSGRRRFVAAVSGSRIWFCQRCMCCFTYNTLAFTINHDHSSCVPIKSVCGVRSKSPLSEHSARRRGTGAARRCRWFRLSG